MIVFKFWLIFRPGLGWRTHTGLFGFQHALIQFPDATIIRYIAKPERRQE